MFCSAGGLAPSCVLLCLFPPFRRHGAVGKRARTLVHGAAVSTGFILFHTRCERILPAIQMLTRPKAVPCYTVATAAGSTHLPCSRMRSFSRSTASASGMLNFTGVLPT